MVDFGQVHVGILAAIIAERLPVRGVFLRRRAGCLVPEAGAQDVRHIRKQAVRIGMSDDLGGGCRQQHEGVAIGLLRRVGRSDVVRRPRNSRHGAHPVNAPTERPCHGRQSGPRRGCRAYGQWRNSGPCGWCHELAALRPPVRAWRASGLPASSSVKKPPDGLKRAPLEQTDQRSQLGRAATRRCAVRSTNRGPSVPIQPAIAILDPHFHAAQPIGVTVRISRRNAPLNTDCGSIRLSTRLLGQGVATPVTMSQTTPYGEPVEP